MLIGSDLTALLNDINISDIKGPLSLFQNMTLEKENLFKLLKSRLN